MSGLEAEDRVFVYLRLVADGQEVARTKVRELAGLPNALADLAGDVIRGDVEMPMAGAPRFEYVDHETGDVLIAMYADLPTGQQVIEGRIPPRARKRMLHEPPVVDVDRFEERASVDLDFAQREQLGEALHAPAPDVLALIREHIRPDGTFYIRLPLYFDDEARKDQQEP